MSDTLLSNVRILNTRCLQDQEPLNGMLEKKGAVIWSRPVSEVEYLEIDDQALLENFQLGRVQAVMISSRHGVDALHRWWSQNSMKNGILPQAYVVGPSSAERFFKKFGRQPVCPLRMNGLALIQKVWEEESEGGVLWFRNRDARSEVCDAFESTFSDRALALDAYRLKEKRPLSPLPGLPDFWLATSPIQAQRTLAFFPELKKVGAVCIGQTTANSLADYSVVAVASSPSLEALLEGVVKAASAGAKS